MKYPTIINTHTYTPRKQKLQCRFSKFSFLLYTNKKNISQKGIVKQEYGQFDVFVYIRQIEFTIIP